MKKIFNHTLGQKRDKIIEAEDPRKKKKSGGQRKRPLVGAALDNANKTAADAGFDDKEPAPKQRRKKK